MRVSCLSLLLLIGLATTLPAAALCPAGGGADQTSEDVSLTWTAPHSPGSVVPGLIADDLILTEVVPGPGSGSFIEIYNPTAHIIELDTYYLSDHTREVLQTGERFGYFNLPAAGFQVAEANDFVVGFPAGATIAPGATKVIYPGSMPTPMPAPYHVDFEIIDVHGPSVPQMITHGGAPAANLSAGLIFANSEVMVLFQWDGACDLVCDVDYVYWGISPTLFNRVNKHGVVVDGPDPGNEPSAYVPDLELFKQIHPANVEMQARSAVGTHNSDGNGCATDVIPVQRVTWSTIKAAHR